MTGANFIRHFKVLGKLCKLYDDAAASESALETLLATTADQVATGTTAGATAVRIFARYYTQYENAIANGPEAMQALAISIATAYMTSDDFCNDLTTTPASRSIANVIAALETEMGAGVSNKTLSTETTSGLVNFFDTLKGSEGTWNTAGSPDYPDSTYVVSAVV